MWRATIKSLLARKLRLVLTALSVVLGIGFVAGTYVLTDTMNAAFDQLFATTAQASDVTVRSVEAFAPEPERPGRRRRRADAGPRRPAGHGPSGAGCPGRRGRRAGLRADSSIRRPVTRSAASDRRRSVELERAERSGPHDPQGEPPRARTRSWSTRPPPRSTGSRSASTCGSCSSAPRGGSRSRGSRGSGRQTTSRARRSRCSTRRPRSRCWTSRACTTRSTLAAIRASRRSSCAYDIQTVLPSGIEAVTSADVGAEEPQASSVRRSGSSRRPCSSSRAWRCSWGRSSSSTRSRSSWRSGRASSPCSGRSARAAGRC